MLLTRIVALFWCWALAAPMATLAAQQPSCMFDLLDSCGKAGYFRSLETECVEPESIRLSKLRNNPALLAQRRLSVITSFVGKKEEEYLEGFLQDVKDQTAFCTKLFCQTELLMGTTVEQLCRLKSDSLQQIETFLRNNLNAYLIVFRKDPGLYGMWNRLISPHGNGAFVTNANMDDRRRPNSWEKKLAFLESHPNISVLTTPVYATDKVLNWKQAEKTGALKIAPIWFEDLAGNALISKQDFFRQESGQWKSHNFPHNSPMWRRDAHDIAGYFDTSWDPFSDFELWLRFADHNLGFFMIKDVLELYFENPMSHNRRGKDGTFDDRLLTNAAVLRDKYIGELT